MGSACDLSSTQKCFGAATALVPRIYWGSLDIELLYDISQNFCDKRLAITVAKNQVDSFR